jgi:hypothetical protein
VVRPPRKLIHPVLKPLFEKWKVLFYANPGAIDLLDLSDSGQHTHKEKKKICRNPALDHYICKHGLWKDIDVRITSSNPARGITAMVLPLPHQWRSSAHFDPYELSVFTNPSTAWVDRIFGEGKSDLMMYPGLLSNPNPRVVEKILEEMPDIMNVNLRSKYKTRSFPNLFLNTNPRILCVLEQIAKFSVPTIPTQSPHVFLALSGSLPMNPSATHTYLKWCEEDSHEIVVDTLACNSHPLVVDIIVRFMLASASDPTLTCGWITNTKLISRNVGIFIPDISAWKLLVHRLAKALE